MSWEFLVTAFVVALVPGTGVLYTVATATLHGPRLGMAAVVGCTLGIVPAMVASCLGLAAVLHTSALAFTLMKYAGAIYLLYLAWRTLADTSQPDPQEPAESRRAANRNWRSVAWFGFLINILNPKLSAFFLALLPQFVDPSSPYAVSLMLVDGVIFMAVTFFVFTAYALLSVADRREVLARPAIIAWLRRGIAATFAMLGVRLAMTER